MRKMTRKEISIIKVIDKLSKSWPKNIQLFADNGTLIIIDYDTHMVLHEFCGIICDGGDPDHSYDENGDEYINV
jgi:hypothetical protein